MSDLTLHRFAPLFSDNAPNPHQQLATASYTFEHETYMLRLIEGQDNSTINAICTITDFGFGTRIVALTIQGLIAQLRLLFPPICPCQRSEILQLDLEGDLAFHPTDVSVKYTPGVGPDGNTPDAAIMNVRTKEGQTIPICVHEFRPGFGFGIVILAVVVLAASGCSIRRIRGTLERTDSQGNREKAVIDLDLDDPNSKKDDKADKKDKP